MGVYVEFKDIDVFHDWDKLMKRSMTELNELTDSWNVVDQYNKQVYDETKGRFGEIPVLPHAVAGKAIVFGKEIEVDDDHGRIDNLYTAILKEFRNNYPDVIETLFTPLLDIGHFCRSNGFKRPNLAKIGLSDYEIYLHVTNYSKTVFGDVVLI